MLTDSASVSLRRTGLVWVILHSAGPDGVPFPPSKMVMFESMMRLLQSPLFALLIVCTFMPLLSAQELDNYRHWTTTNGRRSDVRLKLVEENKTSVRLQREDNGKVITLAKTMLSRPDRDFLRTRVSTSSAKATVRTPNSNDWPQWRGPNRDGKSASIGLLKQWPSGGPELVWNVTGLGDGYSSPTVTDGSLYVMGASNGNEFLYALDASTGGQRWKTRVGSIADGGGYKGPRGSPTIDGESIYAIGSDGTLVCVNRQNGDQVWSKNFKSDFAGEHGHWAYAESPLIDGDKLVCTPGGARNSIVALRKSNGATIWSSPVGTVTDNGYTQAGYASLISATIGGMRQYIAFLSGGIVGVSAKDGTPLWHYDAPANDTANCSTPVAFGDAVFAASGYGTGGGKANLTRRGNTWNVRESYFQRKMENHHGGFVLHDGHIYGTNNSVLLCLDWDTGDIKWQDRCVGKGSVSFADGNLYVRGESGDIALVEATPESYREKGRFKQSDRSGKQAWPHPVIAGKRLYIHDHGRMLCYSLE